MHAGLPGPAAGPPEGARRFEGIADDYAAARPRPPAAIAELCSQLARVVRPALVVDVGCGTGASLAMWSGRARRVVGIEPGSDMRRHAQRACAALPDADRFEIRDARAEATGLAGSGADVVVCSQALHWLEPTATLAEAARVLRPGGVFCAVDCDWPPLIDWELDPVHLAVHERTAGLERALRLRPPSWPKDQHLARMRAGGWFRWTAEHVTGHADHGDADRVLRLVESQGAVAALRRAGRSDADLGLDELARVARRVLGSGSRRWWWTYRLRLGVV